MSQQINVLRWASRLEGVSLLLLFGVAMPLKYVWGMPLATRIVGSAHGLLFLVLIYLVYQAYLELKWSRQLSFGLVLLACIPFGFIKADQLITRAVQATD